MSAHLPNPCMRIGKRQIGGSHQSYFIADIAANHDGDLDRAKRLINLAAKAGADAAKFQHFSAKTIVSDKGFRGLGGKQSHQAGWQKSVFQVYQDAAINSDWTPQLRQECVSAGIDFFTSPYDFALVDAVAPYVDAYKVGSGDITWPAIIEYMADKGKPVLLACGASTFDDVTRAVNAALSKTGDVVLMQCNTDYTGSLASLRHIQLKVLETFRAIWPGMVLGLSDHTPGHASVLGAVALGARVIEKHFTDDQGRTGPDHGFSLSPQDWRDMVDRTRELEAALGTGEKRVEDNESKTVVLQRRALRATRPLPAGHVLSVEDVFPLRPCPADALPPYMAGTIVGRQLVRAVEAEDHFTWNHLQ